MRPGLIPDVPFVERDLVSSGEFSYLILIGDVPMMFGLIANIGRKSRFSHAFSAVPFAGCVPRPRKLSLG